MSTNAPSALHIIKREACIPSTSQSSEIAWVPNTPPPKLSQRLKDIQDALRPRPKSRLEAIQDALKGVNLAISVPQASVIINIGGTVTPAVKESTPRPVSFLDSLGIKSPGQRTDGHDEHVVRNASSAPQPPKPNLKRPLSLLADGKNLPDEHLSDERVTKKARLPVVRNTARRESQTFGRNGRKALDASDKPIIKKGNQSPATSLEPVAPLKRKAPGPSNGQNALDAFFREHDGFVYNSSQTAWKEFYRLAYHEGWDKKEKADRRAYFKDALVEAFNTTYGEDENSLESWIGLCQVLRITPPPRGFIACREAVKAKHVNLVDLVDLPNSKTPIRLFASEKELSDYTRQQNKVFPRDNIKAGSLLRHLLRHIMNPGQRDN